MSEGRSSLEPRRWSEPGSDAPDALRPALEEARGLPVDQARILRLAERLGVSSGVAAGVGLASVAPPASVAAFKLWAALSGVVALGGVGMLVWSGAWERTVPVVAEASATEPAASRGMGGADEVAEPTLTVSAAMEPTPTASTAAIEPSAPPPRARASRRRPVVQDPVVTRQPLDPQAELSLLGRAQDALTQAPRRALTLTADHAQAYPQGVFAQEREVIAIEALLRLQRSSEATARAQAFLEMFPRSTHAPRVRQMLGEPSASK